MKMELSEKIIELLKSSEALKGGEIAEKLGVEKSEVDKILKKLKAEEKKNKGYVNPINSLWGRILIWVLCLSMVAGIVFAFIYAIISNI